MILFHLKKKKKTHTYVLDLFVFPFLVNAFKRNTKS